MIAPDDFPNSILCFSIVCANAYFSSDYLKHFDMFRPTLTASSVASFSRIAYNNFYENIVFTFLPSPNRAGLR